MPLNGIRVVDLSRWIAGPHVALMLGDMGADVAKIESPTGDPARGSGPFIKGESSYFMALNRSKRGIVLDLRSPVGLGLLKSLLGKADVLIENFRPGTLAEMGFDDEALSKLNPRLITLSISGFGQTGPYAQRGCFDSVAQAMGGLMAVTGEPDGEPMRAGLYVADYAAALHGTIGVLLALIARAHTGRGQRVDVALVESLLSMTTTLIPGYVGAGVKPRREGTSNSHASPVGLFRTSDGYIQLSASSTPLFVALCRAMGCPQLAKDPRFASNQDRLQNARPLKEEISRWTAKRTRQEVMECLVAHGVPAGPVEEIGDILRDAQLRHRDFFVAIQHPVAGEVEFAGPVVRLSDTPGKVTRAAPTLGQNTREILLDWLGLPDGDIDAVIGQGACDAQKTT